jgi:predicted transcriptional regulator
MVNQPDLGEVRRLNAADMGATKERLAERSAKGGGKLSRSETVTVRLDPKLRYLAELAARKQRRTLSSYIEWAIEDSLKSVVIYQGTGYQGDDNKSIAEEMGRLWDVDEAERFLRLAIHYPDLLSHQEQEIWKLVQDSLLLQPAQSRQHGRVSWDHAVLEDQVFPAVRRRWPDIMMANATDSPSARSEWIERTKAEVIEGKVFQKPKGKTSFDDLDDEVPF